MLLSLWLCHISSGILQEVSQDAINFQRARSIAAVPVCVHQNRRGLTSSTVSNVKYNSLKTLQTPHLQTSPLNHSQVVLVPIILPTLSEMRLIFSHAHCQH